MNTRRFSTSCGLLACLCCLFAVQSARGADEPITTSGYLSSDETWSGRVILTGDVTIPEGITLTIVPGTTVLCTAHSDDQKSGNQQKLISLEVRGTLIAQGTPSEPIRFTSTETGARAWDQITLLGAGPPLAVIQNCIIENAVVGIHLHSGYAYITNNTIVNNGWSGVMVHGANPTIKNNVVFESGYGINVNAGTASPHISYNNVYGNSRDYWDQSAKTAYTPSPATGNISADPLFVDAASGDYHLQPGSPCIDAGDNSAILPSVIVDLGLDVSPRGIMNGTVDMGAYEVAMAPILGSGEVEEEPATATEEKPSSFKTIGIGIGALILLGGIAVVLAKFLKDRSSSEIYEDEDD